MPVSTPFDSIIEYTARKSVGEYKGIARIVSLAKYTGQSGKTSIKIEFDVDGSKFSAYSGLTENSVMITLNRIISILEQLIGKADTRELFDQSAKSRFINTDEALAIDLATKADTLLAGTAVYADVERTIKEKDENGKAKSYNIKWFIHEDKSVTVDPKDNPPADGQTSGSDEFLKSFN